MTYFEFYRAVYALIDRFKELGLAGKKIAVTGDTCPEWLITYFAAIITGGVAIPLDKELKGSEIAGFLQIGGADAIVFTKSVSKQFEEFYQKADCVKYYLPVCYDEELYGGKQDVIDFNTLVVYDKEQQIDTDEILKEEYQKASAERCSVMLFTSGTTGSSKCVMLSENNLVSCANSCCESVDFAPEDVLVSVLPMHHTYELACTIAEMMYGMTVCINDSLKHVLKNFKLFKPTGLVLVPIFVNTIHKKIWDEARKKNKDKLLKYTIGATGMLRKVGIDLRKKLLSEVLEAFGGNLNKIICGGAAMNPEMSKNFDDLGIVLCEGYGITECSPLVAVNPYYKLKKGSVGTAVPCCEVKIDGLQIGDKGYVTGEILVKGENVMLGYYNNPQANREAFTEDGWFRTGDIGYMDDEGYLFITGRQKSVIVLDNGKNIFPEEIEEYLENVEEISECVVVGRKNPANDELVLAAVVFPDFDRFAKDESLENIAAAIKEKITEINKSLPGYKQIRNIEIRKTEFEKTTTRKIKRFLVK